MKIFSELRVFPSKKSSNSTILRSGDTEILEMAQAREIYITYCFTKDRMLANKQCQYAAKWYGQDGAKRILGYLKLIYSKELD